MKKFIKDQIVVIITIAMFCVASLVNKNVYSSNNIYGFLIQLPAYGMGALALTFCLLSGELNIAMGSTMAFSGVMFALVVESMGFLPALLITLFCCSILGAITGIVVAYLKIDSFVTSLSMMILIKGIALAICNSSPIIVTDATTLALSDMTVGPVPVISIIFIIIVLILEFILKFTVFGRNIYAVGSNADIAKSIGIKVKNYKFVVFIIYGLLAGIGGFFLMTRMNAGSPIIGDDAPLAIIPMAIVGGTALSGGKGGALKTLKGILFMSLLINIMSIFGIQLNFQTLVKGAILLIIIVWDKYSANKDNKV